MHVAFTVKTRAFYKAIGLLTTQDSSFHRHGDLHIAVLPDAIELIAMGGNHRIPAVTEGLADVHIPSRMLLAYLQTFSGPDISFSVEPGKLCCGASEFTSTEITVSSFLSSKESPLPVNATDLQVLRACHNKDAAWLAEYELEGMYETTKRRLSARLTEALRHLDAYGVTREDLRTLIQRKLEA